MHRTGNTLPVKTFVVRNGGRVGAGGGNARALSLQA